MVINFGGIRSKDIDIGIIRVVIAFPKATSEALKQAFNAGAFSKENIKIYI